MKKKTKKQTKLYFAKHHDGDTCVELLLSETELKKASIRASDPKNAVQLSGQKRCGIGTCCTKEIVYIENECTQCLICEWIKKIKKFF
jgi:hypothetical protein